MAAPGLAHHPFQQVDLERHPAWQGIGFHNSDNEFFEHQTRNLEAAFQDAVERNSLTPFVMEYIHRSAQMLGKVSDRTVLFPLLENSLMRLVTYFFFLRLRTRQSLCQDKSAYSWLIDRDLLSKACAAADVMQRDNIEVQDYSLNADRPLKAWMTENIQPIIREYVGFSIGWPWAHIRYADSAKHGKGWQFLYQQHPYGYFHLDEVCYSLPVIVYLDTVDETCGPFSYVEGTDKLPQHALLRAYHQALYHHCKILCHEENHRRMIASLPSVFRGGDLIGHYTGPAPFEGRRIVAVTGPAGKATLFEGFRLVHAGGHPTAGGRKALFIAFRFPRKKIGDLVARASRLLMRYRLRNRFAG